MAREKNRNMIRQQETKLKSHLGRALALLPIAFSSLTLCAATATAAEKNYTATVEDAFNMTMPLRGVRTTLPRKLSGTFTTWWL